jgi:cephalosporin-C deacetylase
MPFLDLPPAELVKYTPARSEPADFDAFWQETIAEAARYPLDPRFEVDPAGLHAIDVFDVTFRGYRGHPIKGWLLLPKEATWPLPCVVEYIGYTGGRGYPAEWIFLPSYGFATLVMDTRGQGSATPDPDLGTGAPAYPGFFTSGVRSPHTYYYRRVYSDAVRAVDAARSHPAIDPDRIAVAGVSQGGGVALAVAALHRAVRGLIADVPAFGDFRRSAQVAATGPFTEIANYCRVHRQHVETVFATLAYFEGMTFAVRSQAPALFSAGLMDGIVPPSTIYAAYNHYAGAKTMRAYEFNQHDGGGIDQRLERVKFLQRLWEAQHA